MNAPPRPVDPLELEGWAIPVARQRYTRRDTAFYALSVGVGQNTAHEQERRMVDPWNAELSALPSMALVLAYPGFWLGDEKVKQATGITPSSVLHGEQSVVLHRPLPVEATVVGHTQVVALVDKGEGRGALLYTERVIRLEDDVEAIATCRQVHFLRGCGGRGGFGTPAWLGSCPEPAPSVPADYIVSLATRPEQALLYRLNGDANPLHIDPDTARSAGLPQPILHGMCSIGIVGHALLNVLAGYDPARIKDFQLRFTGPVFPGETLEVEVWNEGRFRARAGERDTIVIDNGYATIN